MTAPVPLVEIWRGSLLESCHSGHAVVYDDSGQIVESWGNPDALIYPRSACKMVQALPLLTSGAAAKYRLQDSQLALACASHNAAAIHTDAVQDWLQTLGLSDDSLRCGPQEPNDRDALHAMIRAGQGPCQYHNNCSGKHAGFLTLNQHLGGGEMYIDVDHPVQQACRAAFEDATGMDSPGFGVDGCSAPNFQTTVAGMARAMARFASAGQRSDRTSQAAVTLTGAMMQRPDLVAGEGRACTRIMRALSGKGAVKTGAEGVFNAILPEHKLGITLKISDGATRASECALVALLVRLGVMDRDDPVAQAFIAAPILNRRDVVTGQMRPAEALLQPTSSTASYA